MITQSDRYNYEKYKTLAPLPDDVSSKCLIGTSARAASILSQDYKQKLFLILHNIDQKITKIEFSSPKQTLYSFAHTTIQASEDISENQDGSVMGCVEYLPKSDSYILHISADNKIYAPKDSSHLFSQFKNLTAIDFNDHFDTHFATDMHNMFLQCNKLQKLDLHNFDTKNVTNMSGMFWSCWSLQELDISSFQTQNVTDMTGMFAYCEQLPNLNVRNFDTRNVTDMHYMFINCKKLKHLDVTGFDTRNVTNMHTMFWECSNLKKLKIRKFDTQKAIDMRKMFLGCTSLRNISGITQKFGSS